MKVFKSDRYVCDSEDEDSIDDEDSTGPRSSDPKAAPQTPQFGSQDAFSKHRGEKRKRFGVDFLVDDEPRLPKQPKIGPVQTQTSNRLHFVLAGPTRASDLQAGDGPLGDDEEASSDLVAATSRFHVNRTGYPSPNPLASRRVWRLSPNPWSLVCYHP